MESFTINLPFQTLEEPSETTLDEHFHEVRMDFTLDMSCFDDYPTESELQNVIYQCFYDAGDTPISPTVTYDPDNASIRGVLELFVPASPTPYDRFFTFVYNGGRSRFTITQDGLVPESVTLSVSSTSPMFPSPYDGRTITMTGGVSGVEYSLYRGTEFVSSAVCSDTSLSFGEVNVPGVYFVRRPEGYSVGNSVTLSLFDVFTPGKYHTSDAVLTPASGDGGYATALFGTDRTPAQDDILALQNWFNLYQEYIDSWPDFGQRIEIEVPDDGMMRISLLCPPNPSSSPRTFDTGMYLSEDGQSTLSFVQEGRVQTDLETEDNNYIARDTYVGDGSSKITDITYYGGLGYPVQEVSTSFVERGRDLVKGIVYDNMRRPDAKVLLPYARNAGTYHYDPSCVSSQQAYYASHGFGDGSKAHIVNCYESGQAGRLLSSMREGDDYHTRSKRTRYGYRLNETSDSVARLRYVPQDGTSSAKVVVDGVHVGGNLTVTLTTDEDDRSQEVFRDMNGNVILKRRSDGDGDNDTYYVYDIRDFLVCVIQPMGAQEMPEEFGLDSEFTQKWCFTYKYDAAGHLVEKHVPGCGSEVMVYDLRGRLVLSSNALQRNSGLYRYILYDDLDRIVEEGYAGLTISLEDVNAAVLAGQPISGCLRSRRPLRQCTYYSDTTPPAGFSAEPGVVDEEMVSDARCVTLLKSETVYVDPTVSSTAAASENRTRTYFYDSKGRTVQILETEGIWTSRYSFAYDFTGNVTKAVERHNYGSRSDVIRYEYEYDARGRKIVCRRSLNGREYSPVHYTYDDLGRVTLVQCDGKVDELYSYNLQGWPQMQEVILYGQPEAFHLTLNHYSPESGEATPSYAGLVSEAISCHAGQQPVTTLYRYDDLGRVIGAEVIDGVEESANYDDNGNILSLRKSGTDGGDTAISYSYDGNQVVQTDNDGEVSAYTYYPNGNLRTQSGENLQFSYNFGNLLTAVKQNGSLRPLAEVIHLADGTKTAVKLADGSSLVYRGRCVYKILTNGRLNLESVEHDHGRFVASNENTSITEFIDTWHVRDYLGSVRAVYDITQDYAEDLSDVILEQNDYYVFGGRIENPQFPNWSRNRYRFNGKEQLATATADLGLTDYGARMYSQKLSRWTTPDPLADKYHSTSPYAFCGNNPVNYVDPNGKKIYYAKDVSEKFKQQFAETIRFMNEKGTAGDLAKLEASSRIYYIDYTEDASDNKFSPTDNTIYWCPDMIVETAEHIYISPATILAHEASHGERYDRAIQSEDIAEKIKLSADKTPNSDEQYSTLEERRVITGPEQVAARKHGEIRPDQVTRKDHEYTNKISIPDGTSVDSITKFIIEHNNLL